MRRPGLVLSLTSMTLDPSLLFCPLPRLLSLLPQSPAPHHLRTLLHLAPFTPRQCHQQTL